MRPQTDSVQMRNNEFTSFTINATWHIKTYNTESMYANRGASLLCCRYVMKYVASFQNNHIWTAETKQVLESVVGEGNIRTTITQVGLPVSPGFRSRLLPQSRSSRELNTRPISFMHEAGFHLSRDTTPVNQISTNAVWTRLVIGSAGLRSSLGHCASRRP